MQAQNTSIKVPSLAGGVSRTSPTKRRPDQVEEADNVFLTLERSAEKRQGTDFVNSGGDGGSMEVTNPDNKMTCFFEFVTQKDQSVIVVMVDVQPTDENYDVTNLLQVFDGETGAPVAATSLGITLADSSFAEYIQAGAEVPLCDRIKEVRIRDFLCFLNTEVVATYKNVDEGDVLEYVSPYILMGTDNTGFASPDVDDNGNYTIPIGNTDFEFITSNSTGSYYNTTNSTLEEVNTDSFGNIAQLGDGPNDGYYITQAFRRRNVRPINFGFKTTRTKEAVGVWNVDLHGNNFPSANAGTGLLTSTSTYGTDIEIRGAYSTETDDLLFAGEQREDPRTGSDFAPGAIQIGNAFGYPIAGIGEDFTSDDAQKNKIHEKYYPAGMIISNYADSTYIQKVANTDTGTTFTSQDSIAVPDFLTLGVSPDSARDYDTISRGAVSSFQCEFPYTRTPFIRNTDKIRNAIKALHFEPSIVPDVRWSFPIAANDPNGNPLASSFNYPDNDVTEAEDQLVREHRFGVHTLCGNPAEGDGYIFYVEESAAGFPAGYYRVISSPIDLRDFPTTDFLIDLKEEIKFYDSSGNLTSRATAATEETNPVEVRKNLFPQPIARLTMAARKAIDGTDDSPFQGIVCNNYPGTPPYYQRIRTPEIGSVIDRATMPHIFAFNGNPDAPDFVVSEGPWSPRLSGDFSTNPGPSFISGTMNPLSQGDKDATNPLTNTGFTPEGLPIGPTGQKITSIAYWRNRLWLASGTTIVTSRAGNPFNLWLDDINTLSDDDPIDLFLGDTDASEINWIIPFEKSCFVGTNGRTQFIISGAENFIAPSTVSIDSGNEYSVSAAAEPLKVGMYLFFVDKGRLYIHAGGGSANRPNLSFSVSEQAYGYFPYVCRQAIAAPASDYLLFLSGDEGEENMIYVFQQRTLPDGSIGQQSFYRWIFDAPIEHIAANGDLLKILTKRTIQGVERRYLEVLDMSRVELGDVLVDRRYTFEDSDISYNENSGITTFTVPYRLEGEYKLVDTTDYSELVGSSTPDSENLLQSQISIVGDYRGRGGEIVAGVPYEMKIELSKFVMRGEDNTAIDGTITLKSLGVRHYNSGTYDIGVMRQGRFETITTFDPYRTNNPFVTKEERYYDPNGQASARLAANADRAQIQIKSDGFIPVNITNVEAFVAVTGGRHNATE